MHTIELEEDAYKRLEKIAEAEGATINDILAEWIDRHENWPSRRRLPPPPVIHKAEMTQILADLREAAPFSEIKDPVAWQRETRKDRELPFRQ